MCLLQAMLWMCLPLVDDFLQVGSMASRCLSALLDFVTTDGWDRYNNVARSSTLHMAAVHVYNQHGVAVLSLMLLDLAARHPDAAVHHRPPPAHHGRMDGLDDLDHNTQQSTLPKYVDLSH